MTDTPALHDAAEDAQRMIDTINRALRETEPSSRPVAATTAAVSEIPGIRDHAFDDAIAIVRQVSAEVDKWYVPAEFREVWNEAWGAACDLIMGRLADQMAENEERAE